MFGERMTARCKWGGPYGKSKGAMAGKDGGKDEMGDGTCGKGKGHERAEGKGKGNEHRDTD